MWNTRRGVATPVAAMHAGAAPGGGFTLSSGAGLKGHWDGADFTTTFQDVAGTTPANANTHPVARVNNKVSGGVNMLQPTAGTRPPIAINAFGTGKPGLSITGENGDNWLSADAMPHNGGPTMWAAGVMICDFSAVQGNFSHSVPYMQVGGDAFFDAGNCELLFKSTSSLAIVRGYRNGSGLSYGTYTQGQRFRFISRFTSAQHIMTFDGVDQTPSASADGNFTTGRNVYWGGSFGNSMRGTTGILLWGDGSLSSQDLIDLEALLVAWNT